LPRHKTPFEVWFGRKPHWIHVQSVELELDEACDSENNGELDSDAEDLVLTEIETRVSENNTRLHAQMIKANSGKTVLFEIGSIVTLKIHPKLRLSTESI
jgi:hypothetical protein